MSARALRQARMAAARQSLIARDSGAAAIHIEWTGFEEVIALLRTLPDAVAKKALVRAINKCGRIVLANQQRLVPTETGALRDSLAMKFRTYPPRGEKFGARVAVIGPASKFERVPVRASSLYGKGRKWRAKPAWYAHLVNNGARPHNMIKDGAIARIAKALSPSLRDRVNRHPHPGMKGVRFRERSVDRAQLMEVIAKEIRDTVYREARKRQRAIGMPRTLVLGYQGRTGPGRKG